MKDKAENIVKWIIIIILAIGLFLIAIESGRCQIHSLTITWEYDYDTTQVQNKYILFSIHQIVGRDSFRIASNIPRTQKEWSFSIDLQKGDTLGFYVKAFCYVNPPGYELSEPSNTAWYPPKEAITGDTIPPGKPVVTNLQVGSPIEPIEIISQVSINLKKWQNFEMYVTNLVLIESFQLVLENCVLDWYWYKGVQRLEKNNDGVVSRYFSTGPEQEITVSGDIDKSGNNTENVSVIKGFVIINSQYIGSLEKISETNYICTIWRKEI